MDDIKNSLVRIQRAELNNFKNVEHGSINFVCNTNQDIFEERSDILGIYGQNGSGKTAFIKSLDLLQKLLSGKRLSKETANFITVSKESACFIYEFSLAYDEFFYRVIYEFELKKQAIDTNDDEDQNQDSVIVSSERLSYSSLDNGKWSKMLTIIDYNVESKEIFTPKIRFSEITGNNKSIIDDLRVNKKYVKKQSISFIFSQDTYKIIKKSTNELYFNIIKSLKYFGMANLFVIQNTESGLINANLALPFCFKISSEKTIRTGKIRINLDSSSVIPEDVFYIIKRIINQMNAVLNKIIPDLSIDLIDLGKQLLDEDKVGISVELISIRNDKKFPLKYESDGIKKIISILQMLITMYGNPSITLAIDELDSGVFEFLLGEMLKIIDESGKGQLIFTSHNLRPLEILNKKSIIFTTANPKNRYVRLANVKTNHNLRDFYYHDIVLGGQKECIYMPTNSFEIGRAFRTAGEDVDC